MTFALVAQKALCYFEGGDLATLASDVRQRLVTAAARDVAPVSVVRVSDRLVG